MLFNSLAFLLVFLPVTIAGFFWLARVRHYYAALWLAGASLFFYGYWDYRYLPLLLGSIAFNYWVGLQVAQSGNRTHRQRWLALAIVSNLALLVYYKYADFFILTINSATDAGIPVLNIALPIGISFYTFTQIAFLVDTYQGKVKEYRFVHYLLFVTYFPHLIAGPVLHHKEMMPQFANHRNYSWSSTNVAVGLSIFIVGLAKKVLIADNLAPIANLTFAAESRPQLIEAWIGVLAYTFQLYFDFSGYSDMAIGLSRIFGVRLPLNFNSPYKAGNISEFWRRWHMTLSRFLRDYLYVPLGGNRHGTVARYRNLMLTMLLGGLWHGAGWTFVLWGALHGVYLVIHHAWQALASRRQWQGGRLWSAASWALTFAAVAFAWVFFRAPDFDTAANIVNGLAGTNGISLPTSAASVAEVALRLGLQVELNGIRHVDRFGLMVLAVAMVIAWVAPNTQEIFSKYRPCLEAVSTLRRLRWAWRPTLPWALVSSLLLGAGLLSLSRPTEFLYFQF